MTLTKFLLARFAEDEAAARKTVAERQRMFDAGLWVHPEGKNGPDTFLESWEDHPGPVVMVGAERILAEIEAKRGLFRLGELLDSDPAAQGIGGDILRYLAAPYADHPDFNPDWRA